MRRLEAMSFKIKATRHLDRLDTAYQELTVTQLTRLPATLCSEAYIKAANNDADDEFVRSLSL